MSRANMFRIIVVSLLFIILVDTFYSSSALHAGFKVSNMHIRKCRCRVFPKGKLKCRNPLFPTNFVETENLVKCLCSKTNQHKFPEFKAACNIWRHGIPITLV